jgi:methyltransferase
VVSERLYFCFLALLGAERLFELALSRRNARWARARGAIEYGRGHLRWMTLLHASWFVGCALEVALLRRPFLAPLGWLCVGLALAAQALRYWTISSLGRRWNIAVIVLPGVPAEVRGPFRFIRHPNYLAVSIEGLAVPLIHSAFLTAGVFSIANIGLLWVRIRCEEAALRHHSAYAERLGQRPRLWPSISGAP